MGKHLRAGSVPKISERIFFHCGDFIHNNKRCKSLAFWPKEDFGYDFFKFAQKNKCDSTETIIFLYFYFFSVVFKFIELKIKLGNNRMVRADIIALNSKVNLFESFLNINELYRFTFWNQVAQKLGFERTDLLDTHVLIRYLE